MKQEANCYELDGKTVSKTMEIPDVFALHVRQDLIQFVHGCVALNKRQPYAVNSDAGMQHSAKSWGTGRAIARVPRVAGSGTRRAGQGAFANFCRKGRMAHPTKTTRRWQRKTPLNARRTAIAMAVAASSVAPLVESRGHRIEKLNAIPLIVSDKVKDIKKTAIAYQMLKDFNLEDELLRVKESKSLHQGKGKMRNRRYTQRKGLLIIHDDPNGLIAFRNIQGVDLMRIDYLNILELAPGGTAGRLVMWTESAFNKLTYLFGTFNSDAEGKNGYRLPNRMITADNLDDLFYSAEIQAMLDTPSFTPDDALTRSEDESREIESMVSLYNKVSLGMTN